MGTVAACSELADDKVQQAGNGFEKRARQGLNCRVDIVGKEGGEHVKAEVNR